MAEWNKQNFVQWLLGALLAASVTVGIAAWNNSRDKLAVCESKLEMKTEQLIAARIDLRAMKTELAALEKENNKLRDENETLEKRLAWRSRREEGR